MDTDAVLEFVDSEVTEAFRLPHQSPTPMQAAFWSLAGEVRAPEASREARQ